VSDHTAISAWAPYEPTEAEPWNLERVVHLHRRAGFAANWNEIERDLVDGPQKAVDRLVTEKANPTPEDQAGRDRSKRQSDDFETMSRTIGDAAVASGSPNRLKAWWLYRMLFSPDPLGERLTLMWHNHFATSNRKVQDLALMREQNDVMRLHARGPFGDLLRAVVKQPAMLIWLDAESNRAGHPNENLAREMMELFTLGAGHYTENDVGEAARALTGWTVTEGEVRLSSTRHDDGEKTVVGHTDRLEGDALLTVLLEQPATSRRVAERVCHTLLGEGDLGDGELDQLADGLHQRELDIGWAVETVLRSQRFFAATSLRCRISGPVEWTVGALKALELCDPPPSTLLLADWTGRMGQELFYPPNVGGWTEGRGWLSSRALVARANFGAALVRGQPWSPSRTPDIWDLVRRHQPTDDVAQAVTWISRLLLGEASNDAVNDVLSVARNGNREQNLATAVALLLARPESQLT
jgi:uncharacterized protein (DUF1800 family)